MSPESEAVVAEVLMALDPEVVELADKERRKRDQNQPDGNMSCHTTGEEEQSMEKGQDEALAKSGS